MRPGIKEKKHKLSKATSSLLFTSKKMEPVLNYTIIKRKKNNESG